MLSIVVPYLSTSPCIGLFKELIEHNTNSDYELIEIIDSKDVYGAFNHGIRSAKGDVVVLLNDDMFVSKDWDIFYTKYAIGKTVCTGYLVEPGSISVSSRNIEKDFGRTPKNFKKEDFLSWAAHVKNTLPEVIDGMGWFMPVAIEKKYWVEYPNENKFPYPNDIDLFDNILPKMGYSYKKVNSIVYHLQGFSHANVNRNSL